MAQVAVGSDWNVDAQIRRPLQLAPEFGTTPTLAKPYTRPSKPLLASGMRASMNDYERVLHFVFR
jgi:hypothetical protein